MTSAERKRILLLTDGSAQALNVVHYASGLLPGNLMDVVLFDMGTGYPEVFRKIDNFGPHAPSAGIGATGQSAENCLEMTEFRAKAADMLTRSGFSDSAISVRTQVKKTGLIKDIIQESYRGYNAILVGRTGISRLKYLIFGSIAQKLAERVRHIPTMIVGGIPKSQTLLIALDDSMEALRSVSAVAGLAGPSDPQIILCGVLDPAGIAGGNGAERHSAEGETDRIQYHSDRLKSMMDEASRRLAVGGVSKGNISRQFVRINGNAIGGIIEAFTAGGFGTIVVGHRDAIGFTHEQLRGRFSEKILRSLDHMAVWVVS